MKAVSLPKPGKVEIIDIPEPTPGPEEVLVQVCYVGLCGTDLNSYRGLSPLMTYPRVVGHEISGVVLDKGASVPEHIRPGARVMLEPNKNCGRCASCRAGRPNACEWNQTYGVQRDGALAGLVVAHHSKVFESRALSLQELALAEPLAIGYHAANRGRIRETDTVLVIGCGAVGLGVVAAASRKGARVIALDIDARRLVLPCKLGASWVVLSSREDVEARMKELTPDGLATVTVEAVGKPETYEMALRFADYCGRVVCVGYASQPASWDTKYIVKKELDVLGSRNSLRVCGPVIDMMERRDRPWAEMIGQVRPLEDAPAVFAEWDRDPQRCVKTLIAVHGGE